MESLVRLLAALAPAAWTAAAAAYLVLFVRQDAGALRWAPRLAWTAVALHAAAIASPGALGVCPMLVPSSVLSGMGLAIGSVHLVLEERAKNRAIGVFPAIAALLFALAAVAADPLRRPPPNVPHGTTAFHVLVAVLAYAGLFLAALFGTLYLAQRRAMKGHRFGLVWERLPALELLDEFSRRSLFAGVVFLTLTIAFGHVVRHVAPQQAGSYWEAKILATDLLWLAALVVAVLRRLDRLRPAPAARATVVLFLLSMVNLAVVEHQGL
jgi:ABC-type uncharacterized transport system permease subunit